MKLVIIHEYLDNDIQLINSFNSDCIIRHAKDYNHIYSLLNSINDISIITHLVFVYHYPGYCQLPFFDDPHNVQSNYTYFSNNIIEGYLAWKWGLQANLQSNHPYKSAAP